MQNKHSNFCLNKGFPKGGVGGIGGSAIWEKFPNNPAIERVPYQIYQNPQTS